MASNLHRSAAKPSKARQNTVLTFTGRAVRGRAAGRCSAEGGPTPSSCSPGCLASGRGGRRRALRPAPWGATCPAARGHNRIVTYANCEKYWPAAGACADRVWWGWVGRAARPACSRSVGLPGRGALGAGRRRQDRLCPPRQGQARPTMQRRMSVCGAATAEGG